jgi:hypothetical protein
MDNDNEEKGGILRAFNNDKAKAFTKVLEGAVNATDLSGQYNNEIALQQSLQTQVEQQVIFENAQQGTISQQELQQQKIDGIQSQIETAGDIHNNQKNNDIEKSTESIQKFNETTDESENLKLEESESQSKIQSQVSEEQSNLSQSNNTENQESENQSKIQEQVTEEQRSTERTADNGQSSSESQSTDNTQSQDEGQKR